MFVTFAREGFVVKRPGQILIHTESKFLLPVNYQTGTHLSDKPLSSFV